MTREAASANFPCRLCAGTELRLYHAMGNDRRYRYYQFKETGFTLIRWETYSKKPVANFISNRLHVGSSARALIRRKTE